MRCSLLPCTYVRSPRTVSKSPISWTLPVPLPGSGTASRGTESRLLTSGAACGRRGALEAYARSVASPVVVSHRPARPKLDSFMLPERGSTRRCCGCMSWIHTNGIGAQKRGGRFDGFFGFKYDDKCDARGPRQERGRGFSWLGWSGEGVGRRRYTELSRRRYTAVRGCKNRGDGNAYKLL